MNTSRSRLILLVLLCTSVFLDSCKEDLGEFSPETIEEGAEETSDPLVDLSSYEQVEKLVVTSVTGLITDGNNLPIEGANVLLDETEYLTDSKGRFIALDVTLNSLGTVYTVRKDGYFIGMRHFYPQENILSQTKVQLLERHIIGSFNSNTGGTVNAKDELSITFEENSIVDDQGNFIDGVIDVSAFWIDPSKTEAAAQLPSSLLGLNSSIEEVSLVSHSMAAIELTYLGQDVNIAPNKKASVEFTIPASLVDSAPQEIALWSLNEELGIWVEEGIAIKQENTYVGELAHFSFWSCSNPFPLVEFSGSLQDINGNPLQGVQIIATVQNSAITSSTITNSLGQFSGGFPLGELINLKVSGSCLSISEQIGPFESDTTIEPIVATDALLVPFSGNLMDCSNNPLGNAIIGVEAQGGSVFTFSNSAGVFSGLAWLCNANENAEITVYDIENSSQTITNASSQENGEFDLGLLPVCDNLTDNYLFITKDETTIHFDDVFVTSSPLGWLQVFRSWEGGDNFALTFREVELGSPSYGLDLNTPISSPYRFKFGEPTGQINDEGTETESPFIHYFAFCGTDNCNDIDPFALSMASYDCKETCSNFEVVIKALDLQPIGGSNLAEFEAGGIIEGSVNGTSPNGSSIDIKFRMNY